MVSPFQLHRERAKQQQDAARLAKSRPYSPDKANDGLFNATQTYNLMRSSLEVDCKTLKDLPTLEARQQLKASTLIPRYKDYVASFLASGVDLKNEVVSWYLVWLFDCLYFDEAIALAKVMIAKGQPLPDCFGDKTVPTFVADFIKDWADIEQKANRPIEPYINDVLALVNDPNQPWAVHEEVRAKLFKVKGLSDLAHGEYLQAIEALSNAQDLSPKIGVKMALATATKAFNKQQLMGDALGTPLTDESLPPDQCANTPPSEQTSADTPPSNEDEAKGDTHPTSEEAGATA